MTRKTALISINAAWNIFNFRQGLIAALREAGYRVVALAPADEYVDRIEALGVEFVPIGMDKKGVSPVRDLMLLARYHAALRRIRPDVFLGFTAKPNVYGSLAARALAIPVVNNIAGLGTAFIRHGLLTRILTALYRLALRRSAVTFFQNREDMARFIDEGIVRPEQARLLPGSGVDLARFALPPPRSGRGEEVRFLLAGRLLWDKGIAQFVEAARLVRAERPQCRFQLLGFVDVENRTAVPRAEVERWAAEGVIDYLGHSDDVRPYLAAADCIVLPSYREGLPRILLEGGAMAKPLIATDVPGCREVVEHEANGFLCEVGSARSLADAMLRMARLEPEQRDALGAEARRRVERDFDERIVIARYLEAVTEAVR